VTQDMERDRFVAQRWACAHGCHDVGPETMFKGVAAERSPGSRRKERIIYLTCTLRSASQRRSTATTGAVSGVIRCADPPDADGRVGR
jgi:hypothetical protein